MRKPRRAPPLDVATWLNTDEPLSLEAVRGRPVLIEAFQMLCPGCVSHGLPMAKRVQEAFGREVSVIGLHTVFEHHDAQGTEAALRAFLHEYRIGFPVGMDRPTEGGGVPSTMRAYGMQGTPTLVLLDRLRRIRRQAFGHVPDLQLGADIGTLLSEPRVDAGTDVHIVGEGCDESGCSV